MQASRVRINITWNPGNGNAKELAELNFIYIVQPKRYLHESVSIRQRSKTNILKLRFIIAINFNLSKAEITGMENDVEDHANSSALQCACFVNGCKTDTKQFRSEE